MKEELFDYGSINDQHKKAIFEVMMLAKQFGHDNFAEFLKFKFEIVEPNRYNLNESEFIQACEKNQVQYNIQGYVKNSLDPDAVHYPIVSITEDIRKLNTFIKNVWIYLE